MNKKSSVDLAPATLRVSLSQAKFQEMCEKIFELGANRNLKFVMSVVCLNRFGFELLNFEEASSLVKCEFGIDPATLNASEEARGAFFSLLKLVSAGSAFSLNAPTLKTKVSYEAYLEVQEMAQWLLDRKRKFEKSNKWFKSLRNEPHAWVTINHAKSTPDGVDLILGIDFPNERYGRYINLAYDILWPLNR